MPLEYTYSFLILLQILPKGHDGESSPARCAPENACHRLRARPAPPPDEVPSRAALLNPPPAPGPCAVRQALCAVRQAPLCGAPGPLCGASGPLCGVFGGVRKLGGAVCRVKAQRDLHEGYPCAKQGWYRELCFAPFWRGRGFFVCLCAHAQGAPAIPFCACAVPPSPAQGPRARMSARQTANKTPSRPHDAAERTIPAHTTHSHTATGTHNTSTHTFCFEVKGHERDITATQAARAGRH